MSKQINVSGFIIRIGKGSLRKVEKSGSIYDGKTMVVAPFSIYNTRSARRNFSDDNYSYIIHGSIEKHGTKADRDFNDSLINTWINPHEERAGFIRIPYDGRGEYGIIIYTEQRNQHECITWKINTMLTQSPPINNESSIPPQLGPSKLVKPTNNIRCRVKTTPDTPKKNPIETHKAVFLSDEALRIPDGMDMQDYYINQDYSRKSEFGHGRKKSLEWNDNKAHELKDSLSNLKTLQESDPNTFDRGAMK